MSKDNWNNLRGNDSFSPEEQETNNSFVKKVKSRVSELLPSSLSKWFGSEATKKAGVRLRDDEDEDEDEQIQVPPLKRAKLQSSNSGSNYMSGVFLPPRQAPPRSLFIRDDNVPGPSRGSNDVFNDDDKDSESGESTSGYSSMLKHTGTGEKKDAYDITSVINENQLFNTSSFGNDRTLFMDRSISSQANTSLSSRRPSFNASTFGSPSFVDRTLATQRIMKSPFYNGCTMYGGAAANTKPKTPKVYVKPINETTQNVNHSATLSKTARRILDTLEQYATDVNRIPHPLSDKRTLAAKFSGASPYIIREHRAATTELQVPTVPELLKMKLKQRLQDSTVTMRSIASTSKSAQDEYKASKHTNKIRSKLTSIRKKAEFEDAAPTSNLPDIPLPITTLPKFDLLFPLPLSSTAKPVTVACNESSQLPKTKTFDVVVKSSDTAAQILPTKPNKTLESSAMSPQERLEFKFADPLVLAENIKSIIAINNFKFSDPVIFDKLTSSDGFNFKLKSKVASRVLENAASDLAKFKPESNTWECSTCLLRNLPDKTKCVACESPKRTDNIKPKTSFGTEFKLSDDKWECTTCMVRNLNKDSVCVACMTPQQKLNGPITASFGGKFKPPSATWECLTCMIRNKDELDRCAACETLKPGNSSTPNAQKSLDMFKMKSDQWECAVCMVRNPLDKTKCAACETPKSNATQSEVKPGSVFKFGIFPNYKTAAAEFIPAAFDKSTPTFSFGLKGAQSSEQPQLVLGSKTASTQPETPNPTFTFGMKPKVDTHAESQPPKNVVQEEPKPSLKRPLQSETSLVVTKPEQNSSASITSTSPKKYFVSSLTAFSVPAVCKTVTSSVPVSSFKLSTPTLPAFNSSSNQSVSTPSSFGAMASTVSSSGIGVVAKPFDTPNKSLFQPALQTQPVTPKQSFDTSMKTFETPVLSKPAFEMPVSQSKSTFESPAPVFNSGFNAAPAFSFGTPSKPSDFSFGTKPAESEKTTPSFSFAAKSTESNKTPAFGFGATPSSGVFSFGTQAAPSATPAFTFNAPKSDQPSFEASTKPTKNIFEGVIPLGTLPAPLQNGVFNFDTNYAKGGFIFGTSPPSNPFGAPAATNPAPGVFNFGSPQPTSTSTSGFNFGATSVPTFNADAKPSFNFTGGATPSFSALPPQNENTAVPQRRKIRAVRRNPQR